MIFFKTVAAGLLCLLLSGCNPAPGVIRSGDLVFVAIPAAYSLDTTDMDSGIAAATNRADSLNYIHAAILEINGDGTWVIDATIRHGVDRHPLDTFLSDFTLKDGSLPRFEVMRIKGGPADILANAKKHLGEPYDVHFMPDNGAEYCTELIRDSYLDAAGNPIFENAPMNFKGPDGEFPAYWVQLFGRLGVSVPQGIPGTNPRDMRFSPALEFVTDKLQ